VFEAVEDGEQILHELWVTNWSNSDLPKLRSCSGATSSTTATSTKHSESG